MTEAIAIKAAMATKFKYIGGINDYFFGHFLFVANLGFAMGSAFGMYDLCSLQFDVMVFTSEWIETEAVTKIFWPVFLLVTFFVTGISGIILTIKKNVEKRKDQRILKNICVNLNMKCDSIGKINNIKFNQPILNNIEAFASGLIGIGSIVLFAILEWMESNSFIWFYLALCFIIKIIWPCIGLLKTNDFNAFIRRTVNEFWATSTPYCLWVFFRYVVSLSAKDRIHCLKVDQTIMLRHFEETNTRPTRINFLAEPTRFNDIPIPPAYQTLDQSLLEMSPVEDTPAANVTFVVKANAITMPAAYQTLGQFLQETLTVEDTPAADALAADPLTAEPLVSDTSATNSPTTNALANTPTTDASDNEETQKVTRPTYVFIANVNGVTMSPVYQTLAQFIKEMAPTRNTNDDILSEANVDLPVNVEGICNHVVKIKTNTRPIYINVMAEDNDMPMPPAYPTTPGLSGF